MLGNSYYFAKRYEESREAYLKSIRLASLKGIPYPDPLVYQRVGYIYVLQHKWLDAKVMFEVALPEDKTTLGCNSMGIALMNIQQYEEAKYFFSLANYLDPTNADTWAYLSLIILK
jgi:tetratricopeptide (TPR) repeat protein